MVLNACWRISELLIVPEQKQTKALIEFKILAQPKCIRDSYTATDASRRRPGLPRGRPGHLRHPPAKESRDGFGTDKAHEQFHISATSNSALVT